MSQENSSGKEEKDYWRGKYDEAIIARQELHELMKLLMVQAQTLQVQQQQQQLARTAATTPPPTPTTATANALAGRPINIQMGNILAVMPALLMFLFGLYGTTTGADIGTAMIIIGGMFAAVFVLYLLTRERPVSPRKGMVVETNSASSPTPAQ
jgi:hypothetical protein